MTQNTRKPASSAATKKGECLSMTGYAQARCEQNGWAIRVSVKSVNHRFLDVRFRLPEGFDVYELRLRQIVRSKIHRGHVDVNVNVQPGAAAPVQVNRELLQTYLQAADELHSKCAGEKWVLAIGLLATTPAWIAKNVDVRRPKREAKIFAGSAVVSLTVIVVFGACFGGDNIGFLVN